MFKKDDQAQNDESQNEVHVETHTESHVSSGSVDGDQQGRIDELTADLQRLQAEFLNYKRRAEADRADLLALAKTRVVREFLAVRDNFDREQANRPATVDPAWATSIDAIRNQFDQVLKGLGVEQFASKGRPFDPHFHEAVAMEDGAGDHEVVLEELQAGYKLGDNVLRHAIVKVGKTTEPPAVSLQPEEPAAPVEPEVAPEAPAETEAGGEVK
ncbi:MAG: grpE [Patescibacteria group bacterium]|nr:grpE [Patescibacteria group bacterium]